MSASGYGPNFVLVPAEINPRALLVPVVGKLAEQIGRLGADDEQEAMAVLRAIKDTLASVGADFDLLAAVIEGRKARPSSNP